MWTCAKSDDDIEVGGFDASSSHFGIDNTPPTGNVNINAPLGTSVVNGYTVSWSASHPMSGPTGTMVLQGAANCRIALNPCPIPGGNLSFRDVCFFAASATFDSDAGVRNPLTPAKYCYRISGRDVAGNAFTSGQTCINRP